MKHSAGSIVLTLFAFLGNSEANELHSRSVKELQAKVDAVLEAVLPSVVAIGRDGKHSAAGFIATEDGLILTHGHHQFVPSETVSIVLADGRETSARCRFKCRTPLYDCSVLQILEPGPWPHAELGHMDEVHPGAWCLHVGHPGGLKPGRPAVPRMGWIVKSADVVLSSSCMIVAGDSGGPLFDENGRVIGICCTLSGLETDFPAEHASVRVLRRALEEFLDFEAKRKGGALRARIDRQRTRPAWASEWDPAGNATIQVYCDGQRRALGLIVDEDGLILTKASELFGEISCRLSDDRTLAASILSSSQPLDLALLRVAATGLPTIQWADEIDFENGTVIAVPGPGRTALGVGIICDKRIQQIAPIRGRLMFEATQTDGGMQVTEFSPGSHASDVLQIGDIITHIDGSDVRTQVEYAQLTEQAEAVAGDRIAVSYTRNGNPMWGSISLSREVFGGEWERKHLSDRRSGFPSVFMHDAVITPKECGSALVDSAGRVIGINIARADRHATLVIPASAVSRELTKLREAASAAAQSVHVPGDQ